MEGQGQRSLETEVALIKRDLENLACVAEELKQIRPELSKRIYDLEKSLVSSLDQAVVTIHNEFMTRREAKPVWLLVYGLVGLIVAAAVGGWLSLIWKGKG